MRHVTRTAPLPRNHPAATRQARRPTHDTRNLEKEMTKEISVHCIAQTRTNRHDLQAWLRQVGATQFAESLPSTSMEAFHDDEDGLLDNDDLKKMPTDADLLVGVAGKRCYNSFEVGLNPNVSKIREDWTAYIDNVLRSGHGSVIEHATWTWAIEGCTRVMTAEANRHRAGVAISEASLRYIRFGANGIPYWEPMSIREKEDDRPPDTDIHDPVSVATYNVWANREKRKRNTREVFARTFDYVLQQYRELERIWTDELTPTAPFAEKKRLTSMFRRIVPLGVSVGAIYTLNARALRHVMTMRCDPSAEEEIAYAFGLIAKQMFESEPRLFGDFTQTEGGFWVPTYRKV
jgi:thymidylate synthase (FAD)